MPKIWWDTRIFVEKDTSTYLILAFIISITLFLVYRFIFKQ